MHKYEIDIFWSAEDGRLYRCRCPTYPAVRPRQDLKTSPSPKQNCYGLLVGSSTRGTAAHSPTVGTSCASSGWIMAILRWGVLALLLAAGCIRFPPDLRYALRVVPQEALLADGRYYFDAEDSTTVFEQEGFRLAALPKRPSPSGVRPLYLPRAESESLYLRTGSRLGPGLCAAAFYGL